MCIRDRLNTYHVICSGLGFFNNVQAFESCFIIFQRLPCFVNNWKLKAISKFQIQHSVTILQNMLRVPWLMCPAVMCVCEMCIRDRYTTLSKHNPTLASILRMKKKFYTTSTTIILLSQVGRILYKFIYIKLSLFQKPNVKLLNFESHNITYFNNIPLSLIHS